MEFAATSASTQAVTDEEALKNIKSDLSKVAKEAQAAGKDAAQAVIDKL